MSQHRNIFSRRWKNITDSSRVSVQCEPVSILITAIRSHARPMPAHDPALHFGEAAENLPTMKNAEIDAVLYG